MAEFTRDYSELGQVNVFFNENDMICGICRASWVTKQPRCLPCETTHIFCSKCLARLIDSSLVTGYLLCPICRKEYILTEKGVKAFPLLSPFVNSSLSAVPDRHPLWISRFETCEFSSKEKLPSIHEDYFMRTEPVKRYKSQTSIKFLRFDNKINDIQCLNGVPYCLTGIRKNGMFKYSIIKLMNDNRSADRISVWMSSSSCHRFALNNDIYLLTGVGSNRRIKRLKLKDEDRSDVDCNNNLESKGVEAVCPRINYLRACLDGFVIVHDSHLEYYTVRPLRLQKRMFLTKMKLIADLRCQGSVVYILFARGQIFTVDLKTPKSGHFLKVPTNSTILGNFQNDVFNTIKQGKIIMSNADYIYIITLKTNEVHRMPFVPVFGHFLLRDYFVTENEIVFYLTALDGLVAIRYYNFKKSINEKSD